MKRLLSCQASEILAMNGKELKQAILASVSIPMVESHFVQ